jgi:SAM-dependent methyltransferase
LRCRHCERELHQSLVDLGSAPPSNAYLTNESLHSPEKSYPLRVLVCDNCWLVQTEDFALRSDLFDANYAYFSGFSSSWQIHCQSFVKNVTSRFILDTSSHIIEVAANDGTLLQYFQKESIPCTGIEPTFSTAESARDKGIEIIEDFFDEKLARSLILDKGLADLVVANNVLAHVPDINDFVKSFVLILKEKGVATFEFPHLLRMIAENQYDTIYHEHFSYLSLTAIKQIFTENGLTVFDVEELQTHCGSLRVFAQRSDINHHPCSLSVQEMLQREAEAGLLTIDYYSGFQSKSNKVKNDFLTFLLQAKNAGKKVVAYGAAAKGNTLMNYAGVRPDLISFVVDRNPAKQGKYMPGSRIAILKEECLIQEKPDYVVILPWNIKTEVMQQLQYIKKWQGKFVVAVPELEVLG